VEPLVRELAERLLEDPALAVRVGHLLAVGPDLPQDVHLLGSRLSHAATVEPLRRAAPKAGRGRPARWGSERRKAAEAFALDRARLDALHRWIVAGRDDGTAAGSFEGDLLEAVRESVEKASDKLLDEKEARFERTGAKPHAPRLWAARVLLKTTGRAWKWADAERLVKRLKERSD
jgi:hypothetical protein